ncbi:hypothetical protein [Polyangium sp. y55x31]|uniref:hypothetical protein n=1 Tax=Polyangium sp. y55x31 TaxID=3042688 RepID=UPI002483278A|nr:hypothetical protein [Polyangium sp. y55x31]MDI1475385.1 hypothetical protein [Polyangium sp. y55x31]
MQQDDRRPWHGAAVDIVAIVGLVVLAWARVLDGTAAAGWIAAIVAGRVSASAFRPPPDPPAPPAVPVAGPAKPPTSGLLTLALGLLLAIRAGAAVLCRQLQA